MSTVLGPDEIESGNQKATMQLNDFAYEDDLNNQAENLMRQIQTSDLVEHPSDTCKPLYQLANIRVLQGRYAEAENFYKLLANLCEYYFGSNDTTLMSALNGLAFAQYGQMKVREARANYCRALEIFANRPDYHDPRELSEMLHHIAQIDIFLGEYAESEGYLEYAFTIIKELAREQPTRSVLSSLADMYQTWARLFAITNRGTQAWNFLQLEKSVRAVANAE